MLFVAAWPLFDDWTTATSNITMTNVNIDETVFTELPPVHRCLL